MTRAVLKSCPFCGESDHVYPCVRGWDTRKAPYAVDCVGCGIEFIPREGSDVIAAWNRRASTVPKLQAECFQCGKPYPCECEGH